MPTDLRVTEIGLITHQKEAAFAKEYTETYSDLVNNSISPPHLIKCLVNLL